MPDERDPALRAAYAARADAHAADRDREQRRSDTMSRWRLLTFLPGLGLLIWGITDPSFVAAAGGTVLLLAFGVLVVRHARIDERISWFDALRTVSERAVDRLDRNWDALPAADPPAEVSLEGHPVRTRSRPVRARLVVSVARAGSDPARQCHTGALVGEGCGSHRDPPASGRGGRPRGTRGMAGAAVGVRCGGEPPARRTS